MLETQIVGQKRLVSEAVAIVQAINLGKNLNLLFYGRSGLGKTHFVTAMANDIGLKNFILYIDPSNFKLNINKRFQVIDEAHLLSEPELLYPYMDSGKYTFFFLSNYYGKLVEPLRNRCINLQLQSYTREELGKIIYRHVEITEEASLYLARFCKGSPRIGKQLAKRMSILINRRIEKEDVNGLLHRLGINVQGLDNNDRIYLDALHNTGGTASLNLLSNLTGLDKEHIAEIESYLIENKKIRITGRGRKLL